MVHMILDTYVEGTTLREITFRYDRANPNDKLIIDQMSHLCVTAQPTCENCENYYVEGPFCGYNAHDCKIHGNLDAYDHPHHDGDGSKCPDYKRKDE